MTVILASRCAASKSKPAHDGPPARDPVIRFRIVVPTFNSADYVGRCLAGMLEMQPGDFTLHVHVQDGESTDHTRDIVAAWQRRVEQGEVPDHARRRLTLGRGRDAGLYDAVCRGFDGIDADPNVVMTWLGSDDVLLPGALATVAKLLARFPEVRWVTGQPQVVDHRGAWHSGYRTNGFARRDFRLGLHDGRGLWFVMQEGTFWRASLYQEAGGLRRDFRLAGDFDLWRRFSRTDDLVTWSTPLALWTQRAGQTSTNLGAYYREVERSIEDDPEPRSLEDLLGADTAGARFRRRVIEHYPGVEYAVRDEVISFAPVEGMGGVEMPSDPTTGERPFIRCLAPRARLRVTILEAGGDYEVALRVRSHGARQSLVVSLGDVELFRGEVGSHGDGRPEVVTMRHRFPDREPVLTLEVGEPHDQSPSVGLLARLRGVKGRRPLAEGLKIEDLAIRRIPRSPVGLGVAER